MPSYCGTQDCLDIAEKFSQLVAGTDATALIAAASGWVEAAILDFHGSVLTTDGTNYPYWVKRATALRTVYMAYDRRMRSPQEASGGFWMSYAEEALAILDDIRTGKKVLLQDEAPWERGIQQARPTANTTGSIAAPPDGLLFTNAEMEGEWFIGDHPLTYLVEVDGDTGSTIAQQSFRWKYKYGSSWEQAKVAMSWGWVVLADGVSVRFEDRGTFVKGMRWEIDCAPGRGRAPVGDGIRSWQMTRAF